MKGPHLAGTLKHRTFFLRGNSAYHQEVPTIDKHLDMSPWFCYVFFDKACGEGSSDARRNGGL